MEQTITTSLLDFSVKLPKIFHKTIARNQTRFFSPLGIYSALAYLHLGADGTTRDELAEAMHLPKDGDHLEIHKTIRQILLSIENTDGCATELISGLFVNENADLNQSYVSRAQNCYDGEISNIDFHTDSVQATDDINELIWNQSGGKITKLFANPLPPDTSALLVTSTYLNAIWFHPFKLWNTKTETFHTPSGKSPTVTMNQCERLPYANLGDLHLEAISLPFNENKNSIIYLLPHAKHTLDDLISSLDSATLRKIIAQLEPTYVDVTIPRITYKRTNNINELLKELGIREIFTENAKLHNITTTSPFSISKVTDAIDVQIDERGIETSSEASDLLMPGTARKQGPHAITLNVNRPFLMFVYHHQTETVLLQGVVYNPNIPSGSPDDTPRRKFTQPRFKTKWWFRKSGSYQVQ